MTETKPPTHTSDGTTASTQAGHERILAAIGWDRDPRRRRILRELLAGEAERVYLHCYAITRQKADAIGRTRRVLLSAARSLEKIPEDVSLTAWIYLELDPEGLSRVECPEPAPLLTGLEAAPQGSGPDDLPEPARRHLDAHPHCGKLVERYLRFLDVRSDRELRSRAGWTAAEEDIQRFLTGQFGTEEPDASGTSTSRPWLPASFWKRSRLAAVLVAVAAVILAALLWKAYRTDEASWTAPRVETPADATPPPLQGGPTPTRIEGADVAAEEGRLVFHWDPVEEVDRYDLLVFTPKLDTLRAAQYLTRPEASLERREVPAFASGGSFLFRVDGLKEGRVVASTGFRPFDVP